MNYQPRTKWGALALLAGLAGCAADDPIAPEGGTALAALAPADVQKGTYVFTYDKVQYWGCAGEMIHNVFELNLQYTRIVLPNGNYVYLELEDPMVVVGTITGLTSGTVWQRREVSAWVERSTGGDGFTFAGTVIFSSETGPTIVVQWVTHFSYNANGDLTADVDLSNCKVR